MKTTHGGKRRNSGRKPATESLVNIQLALPAIAIERLDELGTRRGIGSAILLETLARRLERRPKFMAYPLSIYAGAQDFDRADLALHLDINEHELAKLACCTVPADRAGIENVAKFVGASADQIGKVIATTVNTQAQFAAAESAIIADGAAKLSPEGLNRRQFCWLAEREGWAVKWGFDEVECWIKE